MPSIDGKSVAFLATDLRNAGDLDSFCAKMVEEIAEGVHV